MFPVDEIATIEELNSFLEILSGELYPTIAFSKLTHFQLFY